MEIRDCAEQIGPIDVTDDSKVVGVGLPEDELVGGGTPILYETLDKVIRVIGSHVEYFGYHTSNCGYCKAYRYGSRERFSYDMHAFRLSGADYQALLNRGWRRSGLFCYYPKNKVTCCPNYSIQCKALEFKLSRSQRRCIRRLNSFLVYGNTQQKLKFNYREDEGELKSISQAEFVKLRHSPKARHRRFAKSCERKIKLHGCDLDEAVKMVVSRNRRKSQPVESLEDLLFPTQDKQPLSGFPSQLAHRLQIKMEYVGSRKNSNEMQKKVKIMKAYQAAIHRDPDHWHWTRYREFLISTPLYVEPLKGYDYPTAADDDTEQRYVYEPSDAPKYLIVEPPPLPTSFTTYHCMYYLDDELIAVGVLDVLPECITTVYFHYQPEYGFLNLGIYSALLEISMVRRLAKSFKGEPHVNKLVNYHLGFYVHECKKMRYKTTFRPSYLLCSETLQYTPTEVCLEKLKCRKYARFSDDPDITDFMHVKPPLEQLLDINVLAPVINECRMTAYVNWMEENLGEEYVKLLLDNFIDRFVKLVGQPLASQLILQLDSIHFTLCAKYKRRFGSKPPPSKKLGDQGEPTPGGSRS